MKKNIGIFISSIMTDPSIIIHGYYLTDILFLLDRQK